MATLRAEQRGLGEAAAEVETLHGLSVEVALGAVSAVATALNATRGAGLRDEVVELALAKRCSMHVWSDDDRKATALPSVRPATAAHRTW